MYSFRQYLLIGFITQIGNKATLFRTEHIACTTNIEILHGYVNSTAQVTEILNSLQTTPCFRSQGRKRRSQQIAECFLIASSYTTTHLMQVAQSEILCLIDDNGIGIRNINAALYNCSGYQHIIIIIDKAENNLFQFGRLHLSMPDGYTAIRNMPFNHRF